MITLDSLLEQYRSDITSYYIEAQALLPELPQNISFERSDNLIIPGHPTGGYTASLSLVKLGIDGACRDQTALTSSLRATIFHEAFHVVQGYNGEVAKKRPFNAIEAAVFEGCATVFARDYANKTPGWAEYEDEQTMLAWCQEIEQVPSGQDYRNLRFFDPATGRKWVVYRTGVFIVDRALQATGLDIIALRLKNVDEIVKLAHLPHPR